VSAGNVLVGPGTVEDYPQAHEVLAETFAFHQRSAPEFFDATGSPPPTHTMREEPLPDGQSA
jgi:hypothetical protein